MDPLLTAEQVSLRPATLADKKQIFQWLTSSNLTAQMLGLPTFPDNPIPSWEEFESDYVNFYFDGSEPLCGRCFIIIHRLDEIGQVNYNWIDEENKLTELDIWLSDNRYTGQGFGTEALQTICNYLHYTFGCEKVFVQPSARNPRAINAYKKAGFTLGRIPPKNFVPDYYDSVLMEKEIAVE